jgi:hypothetical protein
MELALTASALITLACWALPLASRPCTRCKDGWLSRSIGRGTCSWHHGIAKE